MRPGEDTIPPVCHLEFLGAATGSPYIFFIWTSVCNARPIYIYIYIYIYNMDLKKSLIIENLYSCNREV